jgi:hypothetical protein
MSLETYVSRILDAIKTKDNRQAEQLIGSLVMKKDDAWFARQITPEIADAVKDAYGKAMSVPRRFPLVPNHVPAPLIIVPT